jgi:predicted alpha/beta hydrolase
MFLESASEGNPLYFFEQRFGNHLIGFPVLAAAVLAVMYGPLTVWQRCRAKREC